ncbi:MAG: 3-oxoacyl-[acyl-carrier-protein] synthase III C-terminal domain-containing protein [Kiritimatiellia bacterium]
MDLLSLDGVRLEALAACVPARTVANDEQIAKATGIRCCRRAAPGTTVVDLCVRAAERVLAETGTAPADVGAVVCVSFTQRDRMPCAAVQAQARLGLPKSVIAFDVTLACSGWGYGLYLAGLLARQTGRKTLLLDGDVQSAFMDPGDAATRPLLSDGGTAAVVAPGAAASWRFAFAADGAKGDALRLSHGDTIKMDGFGVFRFVATDVVGWLKEFLASASPSDFTAFVPHQPNVYMVRQLAKSLGVSEERTAVSCDELGNLSSASVPATIAWRGVRGRLLIAGFGGGLSVSMGLMDVAPDCKLSVLEV